jgi:hypothetical protein
MSTGLASVDERLRAFNAGDELRAVAPVHPLAGTYVVGSHRSAAQRAFTPNGLTELRDVAQRRPPRRSTGWPRTRSPRSSRLPVQLGRDHGKDRNRG